MSTVDSEKLRRAIREEKAAAFQARQNYDDGGKVRASTFEAGRVAGLALALKLLDELAEAPVYARSA